MTWQDRFDRLLKAMSQGEPPKKKVRQEPSGESSPQPSDRRDES